MGWADSCDDLNFPPPHGPNASTPPETWEEERRRRAEERFPAVVQRATARAHRKASARGAALREFSVAQAMALPDGLNPRDLPIQQLERWRRVLNEAIPVSIDEVLRSLGDVGFVLECIAWEALRQSERNSMGVSDIAYLLDAEAIVGLSIDGYQLGERFEFSVALVDEVARLGISYWSTEGGDWRNTTPRFVSLAARLGV